MNKKKWLWLGASKNEKNLLLNAERIEAVTKHEKGVQFHMSTGDKFVIEGMTMEKAWVAVSDYEDSE